MSSQYEGSWWTNGNGVKVAVVESKVGALSRGVLSRQQRYRRNAG